MNDKNSSFFKQVKNNSVALISLFIAISSLSYNTWRNEKTEANRNQRHAAFEILIKLNELQQVVFYHYYDKDITNKGNPRTGWTYVLTIQDLSKILYEPIPSSCNQLQSIWDNNWKNLKTEQKNVDTILLAIDTVRTDVLFLLKTLK
ncbi:MAG: hypothetical protein JKX98_12800 [Alcanivoracaceae bacterium]|nr:hypothetical protein [Alcanivoracaceae bacterium]